MAVGDKSISELGEWLKREGFGEIIVETFAGECNYYLHVLRHKSANVSERNG